MQSKHSVGISRRTATLAATAVAAVITITTVASVDLDSATAEQAAVVGPVAHRVAPDLDAEPAPTIPPAPAAEALQAPVLSVMSNTVEDVVQFSEEAAATAEAEAQAAAEAAAQAEAEAEAQAQAEAARAAAEAAAATTIPPPPEPETQSAPVPAGSVWDDLAQCESGGNWSINTGNGYYGGIQFSIRSWRGVGGTGYPHEHSREHQIEMGERLRANGGWGHWPACSRKLGLR